MSRVQLSDGTDDGVVLGQSVTDKISFYGVTPIVQRAGAVQASAQAASLAWISVTSNLAAWAGEVSATLQVLGVWKGGA